MNELDDIYSLIKFLRFTPFDSLEMWNNIFNNKTIKSQYNNSRLNNLRSLMKTVCLRRTKDMKFNGSWKESRNSDLKNNYVTFLEMILRLRQICNHIQLLYKRQINQINGIDNKEEIGNLNDFKISFKIEALVEFLNQNNDDDKSV
ncbi:5597_t:CDS:2, partial [Rhizophagus irregularis]